VAPGSEGGPAKR